MSRPFGDLFAVELPEWLRARRAQLPDSFDDLDDLVGALNELAATNVAEGTGGPFAAAVIETDTGRLVSVGVNLVLSSQLSLAHAEMVALGFAHARVGSWDLSETGKSHTLVVNAQPCAMCCGAVVWSGVKALDFSVFGAEVEALTGFDEGPVALDWRGQLEARGIRVTVGRLADDARRVLGDFGAKARRGQITLYNARSSG